MQFKGAANELKNIKSQTPFTLIGVSDTRNIICPCPRPVVGTVNSVIALLILNIGDKCKVTKFLCSASQLIYLAHFLFFLCVPSRRPATLSIGDLIVKTTRNLDCLIYAEGGCEK